MSKRSPVADTSDKIGVIDLGSNTVLLLVLDVSGQAVIEEARITRLGQGVFMRGHLHPDAIERTREAVTALSERARRGGASHVLAVGTEALRRAEDGAALLAAFESEGRVDSARLLTGDEEARYAIAAHRHRAGAGRAVAGAPLVVVDVGGGSTEVSIAEAGGALRASSLPLGSVRLTERCILEDPVTTAEVDALREAVRAETRGVEPLPRARVVAVAGTATTLAALELSLDPYDADRVEGVTLSCPTLEAWIRRLAGLPLERRRALAGLEPARADVIVAGAVILAEVLARLAAERFEVSGRGVRWGVALEWLEARTVAPDRAV
ncbi:MAG: Ppx/GppA family phosphatase [Deltaproteobacteria bacterium]|nr:Ppx/GppA family phosphatase [Deltaproteobacteria bacterium]